MICFFSSFFFHLFFINHIHLCTIIALAVELVGAFLEELRSHLINMKYGRIFFVGASFGGLLAYEMARLMNEDHIFENSHVYHVVIIDGAADDTVPVTKSF